MRWDGVWWGGVGWSEKEVGGGGGKEGEEGTEAAVGQDW
jgi:hypothetical protein